MFQFFEIVVLSAIVGFSGYYVIHMTLAYARSQHDLRKQRTRDALGDIGISVLAGYITNLVMCCSRGLTNLRLLTTIADSVFALFSFSNVFAVLILPVLLAMVGPEYEYGSIKPLLRKCFPCMGDERADQREVRQDPK